MIKNLQLENFGPIESLRTNDFGKLNVVIGKNSSGKTFLLKALYAMVRAREEWGRGDDPRGFSEVLSDKLYWTFQVEKLGDLVRKGAGKGKGNRLQASVAMKDGGDLAFDFGSETSKKVKASRNMLTHRDKNSIFLPPKEVLTLSKVILKSAIQDKAFGFDATYADLVLALQNPKQKGRNYDTFVRSRQLLGKMFRGSVEYVVDTQQWVYRQGHTRFSVNITAEGIKKIAILDMLLGNRFLSPDSIIFIDEPEAALHPAAISQFLDIIYLLSEQGIQFFMATHSYYVVKKLYLIALQNRLNIPILINDADGEWLQEDLMNGLPENEIILESIRLYDQELEVSIQ